MQGTYSESFPHYNLGINVQRVFACLWFLLSGDRASRILRESRCFVPPRMKIPETYIYKGKAVPLEAWTGPEGSRKLRFPDFMTTAQDGGKVVSLTHRPPLTPGNTSGTHFC